MPSLDDEPSVDDELLDELPSVWAHAAAPLPTIKLANAAAAIACFSSTTRSLTTEAWTTL